LRITHVNKVPGEFPLNNEIASPSPVGSYEIYVLPGIHEVEWSIAKIALYPSLGCFVPVLVGVRLANMHLIIQSVAPENG
jgi:hypothetical protein